MIFIDIPEIVPLPQFSISYSPLQLFVTAKGTLRMRWSFLSCMLMWQRRLDCRTRWPKPAVPLEPCITHWYVSIASTLSMGEEGDRRHFRSSVYPLSCPFYVYSEKLQEPSVTSWYSARILLANLWPHPLHITYSEQLASFNTPIFCDHEQCYDWLYFSPFHRGTMTKQWSIVVVAMTSAASWMTRRLSTQPESSMALQRVISSWITSPHTLMSLLTIVFKS